MEFLTKHEIRCNNDKEYQKQLVAWNDRRKKYFLKEEKKPWDKIRGFKENYPCLPATKEECDEMNEFFIFCDQMDKKYNKRSK